MIPYYADEHGPLVLLRLSPAFERERKLLPPEVAARWGVDEAGAEALVGFLFAGELDDDGVLWLNVIAQTGEHWFEIDSRFVGVYDVAGELYVVAPSPEEIDFLRHVSL